MTPASRWRTHSMSRGFTSEYSSEVALVVKNPPANARDMSRGFDLWVEKIPWRRVTHSCLENPVNRGASGSQSQTRLKLLSTCAHGGRGWREEWYISGDGRAGGEKWLEGLWWFEIEDNQVGRLTEGKE